MSAPKNPSTAAAGVLLAAGASRRMGSPKALLPFGETNILERGVQNLRDAGADPIAVVLGFHEEKIRAVCPGLFRNGVWAVTNPRPERGMLSSVQCGMRAVLEKIESRESKAETVLIALLDQPFVPPGVYMSLTLRTGRKPIAAPQYGERSGHPIAVSISLADEILALDPERQTLRGLLRADPRRVERVPVNTGAVLRDMDAPSDYHHELERLKRSKADAEESGSSETR